MKLSTKHIRELIACPQFGDDHYGKWGCLAYNQRKAILKMVETIERQNEQIHSLVDALDNSTKEFLKLHDEYQLQEIEIDRLNKLVIEKHKEINRLDNYIQYTRAEAIKKFADRLKESCLGNPYLDDDVLSELTDNLVKEMTGEKV